MDGEVLDVRGRVVAAPLIHVPCQVEVDRVLTHQLLSHVLQLHALQMCGREPQCKLQEESRESGGRESFTDPARWDPHSKVRMGHPQRASLIPAPGSQP